MKNSNMGTNMKIRKYGCALMIFFLIVFVLFLSVSRSRRKKAAEETPFVDEETSICEIVRAMDFTVNEPNLKITPQENQVYLEGYLKMLKNEIPVIGKAGEQYYKDLWKSGIEFEELLREKETREYPYLYYYDDLDGDGKPELAIEQGCMFLFKYDEESDKCRILYQREACYFKKIVGAGQIWYHDGLHGDVIRDSLITLTDDGTFQVVLSLEEGINPKYPYFKVMVLNDALPDFVDISEENWKDITKPFFEMVENNGLPLKTLEEVFGELLEESDSGTSESEVLEQFGKYLEGLLTEDNKEELEQYKVSRVLTWEKAAAMADLSPAFRHFSAYGEYWFNSNGAILLTADVNGDGLEDIIEYLPAQGTGDIVNKNCLTIYAQDDEGNYKVPYFSPSFLWV